jgi:hypothetical protein
MQNFITRLLMLPVTARPYITAWSSIIAIAATSFSTIRVNNAVRDIDAVHMRELTTGLTVRNGKTSTNLDHALMAIALKVIPRIQTAKGIVYAVQTTFRLIRHGYHHTFGRLPFFPGGNNRNNNPPARHPPFLLTWTSPSRVLDNSMRTDEEIGARSSYLTDNVYFAVYFDESIIYYISATWVLVRPSIIFFSIRYAVSVTTSIYIYFKTPTRRRSIRNTTSAKKNNSIKKKAITKPKPRIKK